MKKIAIFTHTSASFSQAVHSLLGKGKEHARLIYREWFKTGSITGNHPHFKNAQALLQQILEITDFSYLPLMKKGSEQATEKYLLQTHDGLEIEMVLLPMRAGYTLCISSQVGCRMGCAFCETGKMGLLRSLTAEEIVSQLFQARHGLKVNVRNLVFMGMGEPLDNYEEVMRAIRIFTDMQGFALGPSRITVSTSGLVDKMYRLAEEADPALCLAVSVNASSDAIRNRLMPVNRSFDLKALKDAMKNYTENPRRRIFVEYVLIKGKTDHLEDADTLAEYLKELRVSVNLIPYNPQSRSCFEAPEKNVIDAFYQRMKKHGFLTFVRTTKGQKIMAACGQLGNKAVKKKLVFTQESGILS